MTAERDRILIADDDSSISELIGRVLLPEGFEVQAASDGEEALLAVLEFEPHLIVLDVMMPKVDGLEVCRRLRSHDRTRSIAIIMLSAKGAPQDKMVGLRAGADDYLAKPFDPDELVERIRATLRRSREMAAMNPLTGLPGNPRIEEVLSRAVRSGGQFSVLHVDLDNFKAFNDYYGVMRGDQAIKLLARTVSRTAEEIAPSRSFVGHIGGDDLIVVAEPGVSERMARRVIELWDDEVVGLYDPADLMSGGIAIPDRQGRITSFPLMGVSVGIASTAVRPIASHLEAADIAAEMKEVAKRERRSSYAVDRRSSENPMRGVPVVTHNAASDGSKTVLVVDDVEDMRDILQLHCELLGFHVVAGAEDGADAVELAAKHKPAFVILDYKMPGMKGDEAAPLIRNVSPSSVIIAFSAVLDHRPEWADDFLSKDQIAELTPLLGRLIDTKAKTRNAG